MKKDRDNILRNMSGITMVALIVTIIILLILTGVVINLLWGDNRNNL